MTNEKEHFRQCCIPLMQSTKFNDTKPHEYYQTIATTLVFQPQPLALNSENHCLCGTCLNFTLLKEQAHMSKSTKAQSLADINSTIDTCHKLLNVFKKRMNRENIMQVQMHLWQSSYIPQLPICHLVAEISIFYYQLAWLTGALPCAWLNFNVIYTGCPRIDGGLRKVR